MQVEITLEPIDAVCPGCEEKFQALPGATGVVAGCFRCGGAWLDNDAATWIISHRPTPALSAFATALAKKSEAHGHPAEHAAPGYRVAGTSHANCPACGEDLRPVNVAKPAMVVEVCDAHGTFFRGDELRRVTDEAQRNAGSDLAALEAEVEVVAEAASRAYAGARAMTHAEVAQIFAAHYQLRPR